MPTRQNGSDIYYIPPNFIEGGTVFGGMLKLRNAAEAVTLGLLVGIPVLKLPFSLTTRIIVLCMTALPLMLAAVIGIYGESLSSFALNFVRFLKNRRVIGEEKRPGRGGTDRPAPEKRVSRRKILKRLRGDDEEFEDEEQPEGRPSDDPPTTHDDGFGEQEHQHGRKKKDKSSRSSKESFPEEGDDEEFHDPPPERESRTRSQKPQKRGRRSTLEADDEEFP